MNFLMILYLAALFVALTPGVLVTLPKGGKKITVAVVHGLLLAAVWHFTNRMVSRATEGFQPGKKPKAAAPAAPAAPAPDERKMIEAKMAPAAAPMKAVKAAPAPAETEGRMGMGKKK